MRYKSGYTGTPTRNSWMCAKQRCLNPRHHKYPLYGGRGITMCKEWVESFSAFLHEMGERPTGTTLERRNGNLGYYKGNCYWATPIEQQRNRSNNRLITAFGRTQTRAAWADEFRIAPENISSRIKDGWTPELAISQPVKFYSRRGV